jgi:hypothetical protein
MASDKSNHTLIGRDFHGFRAMAKRPVWAGSNRTERQFAAPAESAPASAGASRQLLQPLGAGHQNAHRLAHSFHLGAAQPKPE